MNHSFHNKIKARLGQLQRDNIRFISGTVAPAESDRETMDIESLEKALAYYVEKGVSCVTLQPKFMGSRCQLYLFRDAPEKNYAVSRNGYLVRIDMTDVYEQWQCVFEKLDPDITSVILDGELMPWSALGGGLIDREFRAVITCVEAQNDFLDVYGLRRVTDDIRNTDELAKFNEDSRTLDGKELRKKYPRYETLANFEDLEDYVIYSGQGQRENLAKYKTQLELFGKPQPLHYKPFDILLFGLADGSVTRNHMLTFNEGGEAVEVMTDPFVKYEFFRQFEDPHFNPIEMSVICPPQALEYAQQYFDMLIAAGMEGMMIKPLDDDTDAAPYMKVRGKEYLRLIYGFDYTEADKLKELVDKKRTGKKRKVSHIEYKLGMKMLELNPTELDYRAKYDRLAMELLFQIEEEESLDKRL